VLSFQTFPIHGILDFALNVRRKEPRNIKRQKNEKTVFKLQTLQNYIVHLKPPIASCVDKARCIAIYHFIESHSGCWSKQRDYFFKNPQLAFEFEFFLIAENKNSEVECHPFYFIITGHDFRKSIYNIYHNMIITVPEL